MTRSCEIVAIAICTSHTQLSAIIGNNVHPDSSERIVAVVRPAFDVTG
jgi:hypothetical protein